VACRANYNDCNADGLDCEILNGAACGTLNKHYNGCAGLLGNCICDTNYYDCDGNPNTCEVQNGGACTLGGFPGTWNGPACTCVLSKQNFETGTEADYATTDPLLWGRQYDAGDTGDLIQFGNRLIADLFTIHNDGTMEIKDSFTLKTTGALKDITIDSANNLFMADLRMDGLAGNTTVKLSEADLAWDASLPSSGIVDNINYIAGLGGIIPYAQTMSLEPEYNNTVEYLPGADKGKLELLYDAVNNLNYYKWTTTDAALQEMDVIIRIILPTGFSSWQAMPFNFTYKTADGVAGNNVIDVQVLDSLGNPVTLVGATSLVNAAWTTANITFGAGAPTWTPGTPITIKVKLQSKGDGVGACYASNLDLNYTGK